MAPKFSIRPGSGGPALFENDDRIGDVVKWLPHSGGLTVTAGNFLGIYSLNAGNCDLTEVKKVLADS